MQILDFKHNGSGTFVLKHLDIFTNCNPGGCNCFPLQPAPFKHLFWMMSFSAPALCCRGEGVFYGKLSSFHSAHLELCLFSSTILIMESRRFYL